MARRHGASAEIHNASLLSGGTAPGKTIWLVRMPNEPAEAAVPPPLQISQFFRELELPIVANQQAQLEMDGGFARNVLGQRRLIREDLIPFAKQAKSQGLEFKVRFVSWDRAFWEIKNLYQEIVIRRSDVMIVEVPSSWCAHFAAEGMLRDLSGSDLSLDFWADFSPMTLDWYRWETGIYAVPETIDLRLVFFHKGLMGKEDFVNPGAFLKACARVMRRTSRPKAVLGLPTEAGFDSFHILPIWMWNIGLADIFPGGRYLFHSPEGDQAGDNIARDAVNLLVEMRCKGYLSTPQDTTRQVADDFLQGQYAMILLGPWVVKHAREVLGDKNAIGIALPPNLGADKGERFTYEGGGGLGISARADADPVAVSLAVDFLRSLCSSEKQLGLSARTGLLPARIGVQGQSELFQLIQSETGWTLDNSRIYPRAPEWAPYIEQLSVVDTLHLFWRDLQAITPTLTPRNAEQRQLLGQAQGSLRSRLFSINRNIEQVRLLVLERAERERAEQEKKIAIERAERERERAEDWHRASDNTTFVMSHPMTDLLAPVRNKIDSILRSGQTLQQVKEWSQQAFDGICDVITFVSDVKKLSETLNYTCDDVVDGDKLIRILFVKAVESKSHENTNIIMHFDENLPPVRVNLIRLKSDIVNFVKDSEIHYDKLQRESGSENAPCNICIRGVCLRGNDAERLNSSIDYLLITYEDNGPGIADDKKEKVFKLGFTTKSDQSGNGLGLYIAMYDAIAHGGKLVECGNYGHGVKFLLYLPSATSLVEGPA